jgi:hypothetical protein
MRYIRITSWCVWRWMFRRDYPDSRFGIFRSLPAVKFGRWGFYILGLEIGSRNPQDKIGVWPKNYGLYPW